MDRVQQCIEFVIELEGGLGASPHDTGGVTKFGISQRSYPELDIPSLTKAMAIAIYERDFWYRHDLSSLPAPLDLAVFDAMVNQGPHRAISMLQAVAGVREDGILGPATFHSATPSMFLPYLTERAIWYTGAQGFQWYGKGWLSRLFHVASSPLALSCPR